jgi:hypothetical protein
LQTIPYVGEIRAAELIAVIDEPTRFRSLRRFWAYGGLAVVQRVSSEHRIENGRAVREEQRRGIHLAQVGQPMLKKVLRDVALHASLGKGVLRVVYDEHIARGKAPAIARVALARKIAAIILAVWRSGQSFDPAMIRQIKIRGEHQEGSLAASDASCAGRASNHMPPRISINASAGPLARRRAASGGANCTHASRRLQFAPATACLVAAAAAPLSGART